MARFPHAMACALALISVVPRTHARAQPEGDHAASGRRAQVVVQASGVEITVGEIEDALAQQPPALRARYADRAQLRQLVDDMLRTELLAREADKRGYGRDPAVGRTVKESAAQALVRAEVEDKVTPQSIPQDDVRAYYDAHPDEFHRPPMRRASLIVVGAADEAARIAGEAKKADARGFAELAKQHSQDSDTKAHGGDLGYITREPSAGRSEPSVAEGVRAATFALAQVGDTSAPIALDDGRQAIVRLAGERPARHQSVDDAGPSIRAKLWRERRQAALDALVARLRARDKPEVHTDRIYRISFDDMEKRPTGFAPDPLPREAGAAAQSE
ncbi:MAG: peptidyl-prolyl cis-trans isomerase [Polyangiales bacterium]